MGTWGFKRDGKKQTQQELSGLGARVGAPTLGGPVGLSFSSALSQTVQGRSSESRTRVATRPCESQCGKQLSGSALSVSCCPITAGRPLQLTCSASPETPRSLDCIPPLDQPYTRPADGSGMRQRTATAIRMVNRGGSASCAPRHENVSPTKTAGSASLGTRPGSGRRC
jgi:hypothetical protein